MAGGVVGGMEIISRPKSFLNWLQGVLLGSVALPARCKMGLVTHELIYIPFTEIIYTSITHQSHYHHHISLVNIYLHFTFIYSLTRSFVTQLQTQLFCRDGIERNSAHYSIGLRR